MACERDHKRYFLKLTNDLKKGFQKVTRVVTLASLSQRSFLFQIACNNERAFVIDEGLSIRRNV